MYLLLIECIHVKDVVDRGSMIDPQSPAVFFFLGSEAFKTRRIRHAGVNANFTETFEIEVDDKEYEAGRLEMEVEVLNKGATGLRNFHVGKAREVLKTLIPRINEKITISIELAHVSRHGNYKKGFVSFIGSLLDAEKSKEHIMSNATAAKPIDAAAVEKLTDESREELLVHAFGEVGDLQDDFHCALQTKLITHGRLYVTDKYLCFYSKLFGSEKKVRIPFHQVKSITKGVMVMPFISVETLSEGDTRKYTFHSFWDLEASLKTITGHYEKYKSEKGVPSSAVEELLAEDEESETASLKGRNRAPSVVVDIGDEPEIMLANSVDDTASRELLRKEAASAKYKIAVITEQTLPVSLAAFASLFIEDGAANSYKTYHESVKDTNVVMSVWQTLGSESEKTRDIKFFKPVNLPGLASTRGVKLQKYKRFGNAGLLLSSSTRLEDVPAADTFSVDDTLEVTAAGDSVVVTITFQVTFLKSTFLRGMIESPTNSEMKKWLTAFFEHLKAVCSANKVATPKSTKKPFQPIDSFRKEVANSTATELSPAPVTPVAVSAPALAPTTEKPVKSEGPALYALLVLVILVIVLQAWVIVKLNALQSQVDSVLNK
eukprot:gene32380-39157_t